MAVALFVCPHCEKPAEVQVTAVTRSRPCPHCGQAVVLQVAGKDKKNKRRALLVSQPESPPIKEESGPKGVTGPAYEPKSLEGEVLERMKMDPEVVAFRKRLFFGAGCVLGIIVLSVVFNIFFPSGVIATFTPAPKLEPEAAPIGPMGPRVVPTHTVGMRNSTGTNGKEGLDKLEFEPSSATDADAAPHNPDGVLLKAAPAKEDSSDWNLKVEQVIGRFAAASTADQLLETVANRADVEAGLRDYYDSHPLRPLVITHSKRGSVSSGQSGDEVVELQLADGSWRQMQILVQGGQPRIDWPSFVAWSAMDWETFMTSRPSQPVLFRALAEEASYYENGIGSPKQILCVKLTDGSRNSVAPIYAYAERRSNVGEQLDFLLRQGSERPLKITLRLKYPANATSNNQVWVDNVVTSGWLIRNRRVTASVQ